MVGITQKHYSCTVLSRRQILTELQEDSFLVQYESDTHSTQGGSHWLIFREETLITSICITVTRTSKPGVAGSSLFRQMQQTSISQT